MTRSPFLAPAVLLLLAGPGLAACNGPAGQAPPATATAPGPQAPAPDSAAARLARPAPGPVPFVNGTKVGRLLGPQTPSPPATRTR